MWCWCFQSTSRSEKHFVTLISAFSAVIRLLKFVFALGFTDTAKILLNLCFTDTPFRFLTVWMNFYVIFLLNSFTRQDERCFQRCLQPPMSPTWTWQQDWWREGDCCSRERAAAVYLLIQLFLLTTAAHRVTMATTESTERETIQDLILLYLSFLTDGPLYQQKADRSMKINSLWAASASKWDYLFCVIKRLLAKLSKR